MANQISNGDPDGTVLGQSATDKVGFYGATAVVQPAALTVPAATSATSSTPFGFSQAQADALIVWVRAADAILKANGLTAAA